MRISSKIKKDSKHQQSYRFVYFTPSCILELNLSNCSIGDTGCEALSELLLSSKYLATLKLKFANIASAGMISLFDTIGNSRQPRINESSSAPHYAPRSTVTCS